MRILSGIQPSGILHIGNYFGMMRPAIALENSRNTCLVWETCGEQDCNRYRADFAKIRESFRLK